MRHTRYLLKIIASNEWASRVEFLQTSFPEASAMVFHVGWERFWLCLFAGRTLRDQNNEVSRFLKPQCANSKFTLRTNCSISGLNSLVCGSDSWFWLMVLTHGSDSVQLFGGSTWNSFSAVGGRAKYSNFQRLSFSNSTVGSFFYAPWCLVLYGFFTSRVYLDF